MIRLTDKAQSELQSILAQQDEEYWIRLSVTGRGPQGFEYELTLLKPEEKSEDDLVVQDSPFTILVEAASAENIEGAQVDFVEQNGSMGFKIDNPNPLWRDQVALRVQDVIDKQINPGVASHGGHVMLLDVKEHQAFIKMGGGCQGCGMASVTLKQGVEVAIKEAVPEITEVLDTTDHASGANPYYQPAKGGASPFDT